ncbi:hypothetical protein ADU59_13955 [Pararhizobium polonicum]|uniref:Uncharacterized protein n=2 Tax=Pararhizobium polonicum TaxID=1612624 RepID=A0A1C7P115_9HYPH|nr:hypothetical protein ADU59_13955 [Pararhizobium polonicum]
MGHTMKMDRHLTQLLDTRLGIGRKLGIGFGVCAAVIGLAYAAAHINPQEAAGVEDRVAADAGKREDKPTKLQTAVDASPIVQVALLSKPNLPVTAIPSAKPVSSPKRAISHADAKTADSRAAMPSGVLRFDHCVPRCETQDPLIVGYPAPGPDRADIRSAAIDEEDTGFNLHPLQEARYILGRTAEAPRAALRKGRQIIDNIVGPD